MGYILFTYVYWGGAGLVAVWANSIARTRWVKWLPTNEWSVQLDKRDPRQATFPPVDVSGQRNGGLTRFLANNASKVTNETRVYLAYWKLTEGFVYQVVFLWRTGPEKSRFATDRQLVVGFPLEALEVVWWVCVLLLLKQRKKERHANQLTMSVKEQLPRVISCMYKRLSHINLHTLLQVLQPLMYVLKYQSEKKRKLLWKWWKGGKLLLY